MRRVVIAGGGLTGLAAARRLSELGVVAPVLEREDVPGGACRTLSEGGFDFDLTGHLLHLGRAESVTLLNGMGLRGALKRHRRRASVALGGRVTPYPIQIHTHRLPAELRRDCVLGFIRAQLGDDRREPRSFAEWVLHRFGDGLARHFFFPYNRKLYCTEPEELTTDWVGRYVPRPRLEDVIDGAFGLYRAPVGYNASFLYPRQGGIGVVPMAVARELRDLRLGREIVAVDLARREIGLAGGEVLAFDRLVSTLPLTRLAAISTGLREDASAAAARLRAVAVVNLNYGVDGPPPRRDHWLYVPEPRFPFYRVGIPSNYGHLAPPGSHTLSLEVSLPVGAAAPSDLEARCLQGLEELGLLRDRGAVRARSEVRIDPAYVVYDRSRSRSVATLIRAFRRAGVIPVGRWAEWKYSTMEDALWDGIGAAEEALG